MAEYWEEIWKAAKKDICDLFFENVNICIICGQKEGPVCPSCRETYFRPETPRCNNCGKLIKEGSSLCEDCLQGRGPAYLKGVTALGYYQGEWKKYIHRLKFYSQPYLLVLLEKEITNWAVKNLPVPDLVIPVPISEERILERGFNQAEVLASLLARALFIKQENGLQRIQETVPQSSLGRKERLKNLKGVFRSRANVVFTGKTVWLVDDVITTGATLDECSRVLMEAGAEKVYGFCLAAGGIV